MTNIQRFESNGRLSRTVVHNGIIYLSGITSSERGGDITVQTKDVLDTIDRRLAEAGSSKEKILSVQIWLRNIDLDFAGLNLVWDAWVPSEAPPARATCEGKLAAPDIHVEMIVIATT